MIYNIISILIYLFLSISTIYLQKETDKKSIVYTIFLAIFALTIDFYYNTVGLQNFYLISSSAIIRNISFPLFIFELIKILHKKYKSKKNNSPK